LPIHKLDEIIYNFDKGGALGGELLELFSRGIGAIERSLPVTYPILDEPFPRLREGPNNHSEGRIVVPSHQTDSKLEDVLSIP
jgi:hypothetical protein